MIRTSNGNLDMSLDCCCSIRVTVAPSEIVRFPWSGKDEEVGGGARAFSSVALRPPLERLLSRLVWPIEGHQAFRIHVIGQAIGALASYVG